jgi:hypothetical protein
MNRTYDIFRVHPDSTPLWVDAVVGLEQARNRLNELARVKLGDYMIYDSRVARFIESYAAAPRIHPMQTGDSL